MEIGLSFEEKYNAIGRKDNTFEGVFITAVHTTGIFCRPSCRARKPKAENVTFYKDVQGALQNGFRPCKMCKPMELEGETPDYIKEIINDLHQNPYLRLKDADIEKRGIEPNQIRRWFKKNHHMTFQAYQRLLRINQAYNTIKGGNSISDTAFGLGYESLSGFNDGFQTIFGKSPSNVSDEKVINIVRFTTDLGPMFACATEKGLCLLEFTDRKNLDEEFKALCKDLSAVILPGKNKFLDQIQSEIAAYFKGDLKTFTLPLDVPGTEFQQGVWNTLKKIPYGDTWTYQKQAIELNNPKAVRAVASANGLNRLAIVIPCHRVIGSDGSLTGYAGGLDRKRSLLNHEKRHSGKAVQQAISF